MAVSAQGAWIVARPGAGQGDQRPARQGAGGHLVWRWVLRRRVDTTHCWPRCQGSVTSMVSPPVTWRRSPLAR